MAKVSNNNRKIARNTLFMYARKAVTLILSLYTSRLLLERLGDFDFGLYGLVGSIVIVFNSIRSLFSSSIQRFVNIEKVRPASDVSKVFSIGVNIHLLLAGLFIVVAEVGGLIVLPGLNFPQERYWDAFWILQFSILTSAVSVLTVPFDALIIANEKFGVFAVISIIEHFLKLIVVIILIFNPFSRVVFYAMLILAVAIVIRSISSIYCKHAFTEEAKYKRIKDKTLFREMLQFTKWQFAGNLGFSLSQSGLNLVINIFGGVVVNTARSIAQQVISTVQQFLSDVNISFQPRTMMLFTQGETASWMTLTKLNSKACAFIFMALSFPLGMFTHEVIQLWLGQVPDYVVLFVQILLVYGVIRSLHGALDVLFKSYGDIKAYQLTECIILSSVLPISYVILKIGAPVYFAFITMAFMELLNTGFILYLAHKKFGFNVVWYFNNVLKRILVALLLLSTICISRYLIYSTMQISTLALLSVIVVTAIAGVVVLIPVIFTKEEVTKLLTIFKK